MIRFPNGERMRLSTFAGGYTRGFARAVLQGAAATLRATWADVGRPLLDVLPVGEVRGPEASGATATPEPKRRRIRNKRP